MELSCTVADFRLRMAEGYDSIIRENVEGDQYDHWDMCDASCNLTCPDWIAMLDAPAFIWGFDVLKAKPVWMSDDVYAESRPDHRGGKTRFTRENLPNICCFCLETHEHKECGVPREEWEVNKWKNGGYAKCPLE